jgi:CRISPR-associated protein Cas5h
MKSLLVFDLVGPMAHFRKFYANSSSLSYRLPPRTVLTGIIAALLGRERDHYYEELALERTRIGVALKTPVRTLMQTVNYIYTKNEGWDGSKGHTQIPVEFVLPRPPLSLLRYRIYFAHVNEELAEDLYRQLREERYRYPLYLGLTECPAWVESPRLYQRDELHILHSPKELLPIETAVPVRRLAGDVKLQEGLRIYKDRMPFDFHPDRRLKSVEEVLWEAEGRPMPLMLQGEVFRLPGQETYNVFLELE